MQSGSFAAPCVLLIGGGPSVTRHVDAISRFVAKTRALVVFSSTRHLAHSARIGGTQVLCLPGHDAFRAGTHDHLAGIAAVIVPTPPRVPGCLPDDVDISVFQAPALRMDQPGKIGPVSDTGPLGLALGATQALGTQVCYLAGFDGYEMASIAEQELSREVELALSLFRSTNPGVKLRSLTPTSYNLDPASVYSLVAAVD